MDTRKCRTCSKTKPLNEKNFRTQPSKLKKFRFRTLCRICDRERHKKYLERATYKEVTIQKAIRIKNKKCTKCGKTRLKKFFSPRKNGPIGSVQSYCKDCCKVIWDTMTEKQKFHAHLRHKAWHLMKSYRMTMDELITKLKEQNYLCAMCGIVKHQETHTFKGFKAWRKKGSPRNVWLSVDHNHETDEVRDLLCPDCNRAYGLVHENTQTIKGMLDYHEKWRKVA